MSGEALPKRAARPLRFAQPTLYRLLLEALAVHHLHPYDVWAEAEPTPDGWSVTLRYGEGLLQERKGTFGRLEDSHDEAALASFYREAAADCRKVLMAEAYKLMKL